MVVTLDAISHICHNHIAAYITMLGGKSSSDIEAIDSCPDDDTVHWQVIIFIANLGGRNCRLPVPVIEHRNFHGLVQLF